MLHTSYQGRLNTFVQEMSINPIKIQNDRLADELLDQDYKFRRSKFISLNKSIETTTMRQSFMDFGTSFKSHLQRIESIAKDNSLRDPHPSLLSICSS
jgi:hypothetical protein